MINLLTLYHDHALSISTTNHSSVVDMLYPLTHYTYKKRPHNSGDVPWLTLPAMNRGSVGKAWHQCLEFQPPTEVRGKNATELCFPAGRDKLSLSFVVREKVHTVTLAVLEKQKKKQSSPQEMNSLCLDGLFCVLLPSDSVCFPVCHSIECVCVRVSVPGTAVYCGCQLAV